MVGAPWRLIDDAENKILVLILTEGKLYSGKYSPKVECGMRNL